MINAIMLAAALGVVPATNPVPVPSSVPPPQARPQSYMEWSLEGRVGINEDSGVVLGLTLVPDVEFPLGIWLDAQELKRETTNNYYHSFYIHDRKITESGYTDSTTKKDWTISGGISWRFR